MPAGASVKVVVRTLPGVAVAMAEKLTSVDTVTGPDPTMDSSGVVEDRSAYGALSVFLRTV
jgi:hypothetical protein